MIYPKYYLLLILIFITSISQAQYLNISHAWVREAPPGVPIMVAYVQIHNSSQDSIWITGATSPAFGAVEIHESSEQDGVARMARLDRIKLAPNQTAVLEAGGKHLMLFRPQQPLKAGDQIDFALTLGNGKTESFTAEVRKAQ